MTVPGNVNRGDTATSAWANQLLQAVRDEIADRTNGDAALSTRVSANAGNIGELQTEAATASQSIADNEGRITTLEARPSGGGGTADLSAYRTSADQDIIDNRLPNTCLLYTSPSPRDS